MPSTSFPFASILRLCDHSFGFERVLDVQLSSRPPLAIYMVGAVPRSMIGRLYFYLVYINQQTNQPSHCRASIKIATALGTALKGFHSRYPPFCHPVLVLPYQVILADQSFRSWIGLPAHFRARNPLSSPHVVSRGARAHSAALDVESRDGRRSCTVVQGVSSSQLSHLGEQPVFGLSVGLMP